MWTMSNSLDKFKLHTGILKVFSIGLVCVLLGCISAPPLDTPKERPAEVIEKPSKGRGTVSQRATIVRVDVRVLQRNDPRVQQIIHPDALRLIITPILIEVKVKEPFDPRPRTSSPVIVLNGVSLGNSVVDYTALDRIRVVIDHSQLKAKNSVTVAWTGDEEETKSLEPKIFTLDDISK